MTAVVDPTIETTATSTPATTEAAEAPVNLSAFDDAVTNAISDGAPSEDEIKVVRRAYGELEPRKGKSAARAKLDDDIKASIEAGNVVEAQALFKIKDAISAAGGLKGTRTAAPKNPTESHVNNVLSIQIAYSLAYSNVPANVDENWKDQVKADAELEQAAQSYRAWLSGGQEGEEPNVAESAKAGARISLGKAPKGQGRKPGKKAAAAEANPAAGALDDAPQGTPAPAGEAPEGWEA